MTIGEMSKKINLPKSTLRYYEKKGLLIVEREYHYNFLLF